MVRYALIVNGIVDNVVLWDGVEYSEETPEGWSPPPGVMAIETDYAEIGWSYIDGAFIPPPAPEVPPPTEAEILASQSSKLQQAIQLAAAQKSALAERISQINDAIDFGDATESETAELPLRQDQLAAWKRYATLLGRVTTQEGWYATVVWPVQPAEGMDLSVSAATAPAS